MQNDTSITMLNTSLIVPNKYQPRKIFDETELTKLAESIKIYGIINPILVRKKEDKYEIIAGERRFRATKMLGLTEIPVIIKNADEQQMAELALIENIQRKELSPIEEAKSYEEIMKIGNQTQQSLAQKLGKSQSAIANKIRLLSLPQEVQDALSHKKISERHARSLLTIEDKSRQLEILNKIINKKLTVKETDQIINSKEIGEEEIKNAIDELMKSLNITDDSETNKKEEKEDDNMINGNFFPNYDNNNNSNNNASLNMMNMQSINQQQPLPEPEMVMPTMNMQPEITVQQQMQPTTPQVDLSQLNVAPAGPPQQQPVQLGTLEQNMVPTMETTLPNQMPINNSQMINEPIPNQVVEEQTPITQITPLFNTNIEPTPTPQEPMMQQSTPIIDEPLFNPNAVMPSLNQEIPEQQPIQPAPVQAPIDINPINIQQSNVELSSTTENQPFEVPITPIVQEPTNLDLPQVNKLEQLKELLAVNGYTYKLYGNNESDCIIIELPKQ